MSTRTEIAGIFKENGALLNKDNDGLQAYKARKRQAKKIGEIEQDLHEVKESLHELKGMIRSFLSR